MNQARPFEGKVVTHLTLGADINDSATMPHRAPRSSIAAAESPFIRGFIALEKGMLKGHGGRVLFLCRRTF